MKKQKIKIFFTLVSTNSNVAKEANPIETIVSVEVSSGSSRNTETNSTFTFPKTDFAKQRRLCQAHWFAEYKW